MRRDRQEIYIKRGDFQRGRLKDTKNVRVSVVELGGGLGMAGGRPRRLGRMRGAGIARLAAVLWCLSSTAGTADEQCGVVAPYGNACRV